MYLTREEEKCLSGEYGGAVRRAMEFLVRYGEYQDAEDMIPVTFTRLDCSFLVLRRFGLRTYEKMANAGAKFKIPVFARLSETRETLMAPCCNGDSGNRDEERAEWILRGQAALKKMGAIDAEAVTNQIYSSFFPRFGTHVVGGSSPKTSFFNSVIGARMNLERGATLLFSGITGVVPRFGFHLTENRRGKILVDVQAKLRHLNDWSALGWHVGYNFPGYTDVPVFIGLPDPSRAQLYTLCCSHIAASSCPLYHVPGVTPEATTLEDAFQGEKPEERIKVEDEDIAEVYERYNFSDKKVDVVNIAMDNMCFTYLIKVVELMKGKKVRGDTSLFINLGGLKTIADRLGYTKELEKAGAELNTGFHFGSLTEGLGERLGIQTIVTDNMRHHLFTGSSKGRNGRIQVGFRPLDSCIKAAIRGK